MIDNFPVYFQITEKRRCANRLTLCWQKQRYKTITSLFAFLLLFFATSCNQHPVTQEEERNELIEQMRGIRTLNITPDSMHVLLNTLWDENAQRMTENEKVTFYNTRGLIYGNARELEAAETNLLRALYYLEKLNNGDLSRQARIVQNIGTIRWQRGDLAGALDAYQQAATKIEDTYNEVELLLIIYFNKIDAFSLKGELDSSLYYSQLVLDIARREELCLWEALILESLANRFVTFGRYAQAEENLRSAIPILIEYDNLRMLWRAYANLATILFVQSRFEEGLPYAKKSDEIAATVGLPAIGMASYYEQRGRIYLEEGDYNNNLTMLYQALALRNKLQDVRQVAEIQNMIGRAHLRMRNFDRAYYYSNAVRRTAQESGLLSVEADAQSNLAIIYAARGDMDNFLTATETERRVRQQFINEQNIRTLQEMQTRYETEIKQLLITQQAEEIRYTRRRNVFLSIILVLIVAFSVITFLFYRRKMQEIRTTVRHYEELLKYRKESQSKSKNDVKDPSLSEMSQRLIPQIEHLFKEEKIYKQPGLSLDDVAKMLNTNRSYLSAAVNDYYQKKFPEFVNTFRIDDAIEMFKEQREGGEYANFTIQAIGEEVGFVGKTTFYSAFKQIVGVTPSEYLKMLEEK